MTRILIAGFGGQGVLFLGKLLAQAGLSAGREVSWLPSYGPEMRGGTANCSVILSGSPIGSPIVDKPDLLIAMNLPSYTRYECAVAPGGMLVYDSSLIQAPEARADIRYFGVSAARIASDEGLDGLSNMILLGKAIKESKAATMDDVSRALVKAVPAKRASLIEKNQQAIALGNAQ